MKKKETEKNKETAKRREGENRFIDDKAAAARRFGDVAREGDVGEVGVGREVIMEGGLLLVSCVCVRPRGESAKAGEDCGSGASGTYLW